MFIKGGVYVILMSAQTLPPPPPPPRVRPTGVTILAILGFIVAALFIFAGIAIVALGPLITSLLKESMPYPYPIALLAGVLGVALLISGGIGLIISWGLWTGRGWAWWLTVIFSALSLLSSLLALPNGIIGLLVDALILYYFFKPHVKDYFGVKVSFST